MRWQPYAVAMALERVARLSALAPLLVVLLLLAASTHASEGDESEVFEQCHNSCYNTGCTKTPGTSNTCDIACQRPGHRYQPPLSLQVMRWDCSADCAYHCMWALEGPKAAARAGPVVKYFGKWPFIRVAGAQEIASVLFSIANLLAHLHNLRLFLRLVRGQPQGLATTRHAAASSSSGGISSITNGYQQTAIAATASGGGGFSSYNSQCYPYTGLWVIYALVNINAWVWSSIFHCRDTWLTERLDYFSADLVVVVGLGVVLARTMQLTTRRRLALLSVLLGAALLQHVHYMAFVKFDYGYNMSLCIAVGLATAAVWLAWVTRVRHPGRFVLYKFMLLVHVAMLLEVLDFPPLLWLVDAHALWHAATVPLTYLWYQFVAADVAACCQQQLGDGAAAGVSGAGRASVKGGPAPEHQQLLGKQKQ